METAAIAMQQAMKATKWRLCPYPSPAPHFATAVILNYEGLERSEAVDLQLHHVTRSQPWVGVLAVHERELEDAAGAARPASR